MDGKDELLGLSDQVFARTAGRLDGLDDDEYLWEPAPLCWSVRVRDDGTVRGDRSPMPESPPLTTIAWRLWHLTECYGQARNELLLRGSAEPGGDERCAPRAHAAEALAALAAAHDWWQALLSSLSDDELSKPMGPVAGRYAESTRAAFVLHMLDEHIHHAAEVALLRDLYAATVTAAPPPEALRQVVAGRRPGDADVEALRAERPDLVRWAATNGHWRAVPVLVGLGFDIDAERDGATALHHAAAAGETEVAQLLVAHGADPARQDATFHATPAGWAEFFGHGEVAAELQPG
jgi:uncharacterized damage-inducible protein DinB